jgi:two-component system LytT family response regulator
MTLRALVVDDEPIARRRMRRLLRAIGGVEVIGECGDGAAAVAAVTALRPDVTFLDVQMPEVDGFEVVARLDRQPLPVVIFVTAFDRYALRAFEVHAVDYLMKPVAPGRLRTAVARAREWLARGEQAGLAGLVRDTRERRRYVARLPVRSRGRVVMVDVDAIDWIQAADNYVTVHAGGQEYLLREALTTLERQLDPLRFVRIHRSAIVHLDRVAELRPASHGDFAVTLQSGAQLTLSRFWRDRVETVLGRALP